MDPIRRPGTQTQHGQLLMLVVLGDFLAKILIKLTHDAGVDKHWELETGTGLSIGLSYKGCQAKHLWLFQCRQNVSWQPVHRSEQTLTLTQSHPNGSWESR